MPDARRYRLDDLRRWAAAMAQTLGIPPARASALASQLLWFDAAGASAFGITSLPTILERIESRRMDPLAEPVVVTERGATAVLDGREGVPLLVFERAAGLASEKARETGVGLVRVLNVGAIGSAAGIAAELAIGPTAAVILGPDGAQAVAVPSPDGLPVVYDPALAPPPAPSARAAKGNGGSSRGAASKPARAAIETAIPWASWLATDGGWLLAAISVIALEPLTTFQQRVGESLRGLGEAEGRLLPGPWETRRREVRERGVALAANEWKPLQGWSERLGVAPPEPSS